MTAKRGTLGVPRRILATVVRTPSLVIAVFVIACGHDEPYQLPINNSGLAWFPLAPASLQLAPGDSTMLLLAVRDSLGDTLSLASLPEGRFAVETREPAIVTVRAGAADTVLALFRVHLRADTFGTDTLRFALLGTFCLQRTSLFAPPQCFTAAWFPPAELPILIQ